MSKLSRLGNWLRLFPFYAKLHPPDTRSIFFHSWQELANKRVNREEFLLKLCRGKRILHFGFADAPFSEERIKSGSLLHQKLQKAAAFLHGADIDVKSLELYRKLTGDLENSIVDIQQRNASTDLSKSFDIVLFPEVLEHLLRPAEALANLREICLLNAGAKLCITTPNAFSLTGFDAAVDGNELVHPDHYYYFSPTTLAKLLKDTGFSEVELWLYSAPSLLASPGLTHHGLIATCEPRKPA